MRTNATQHVLRALRAHRAPMSATALGAQEVLAPDVVTRALWALRAAGLAESERIGDGVFWRATSDGGAS